MAVKKSKPAAAKAKKAAPVKTKKLAQIKTIKNDASVTDFINKITDEQKRKDCFTIAEMMKKATGDEPKMWGTAIIGFGNRIYKSPKSGREVDWMKIGFSPRKANFSLYISASIGMKEHEAAFKKLGKFKTGGGCLYINKLADVDQDVLKTIIETTLKNYR